VASESKKAEEANEGAEPTKADQGTPPIRGAFRKGALLAALLIIPGLSKLVAVMASDPLALAMAFDEIFATVAVFAGLPALLVFGGIGKNISRQVTKSRKAMVLRGIALGAIAGVSLALLAAIPTATLPVSTGGSVTAILLAAAIGATTGALLGLWIHHAHKRACAKSEA
jgi:hypothetical protein